MNRIWSTALLLSLFVFGIGAHSAAREHPAVQPTGANPSARDRLETNLSDAARFHR